MTPITHRIALTIEVTVQEPEWPQIHATTHSWAIDQIDKALSGEGVASDVSFEIVDLNYDKFQLDVEKK